MMNNSTFLNKIVSSNFEVNIKLIDDPDFENEVLTQITVKRNMIEITVDGEDFNSALQNLKELVYADFTKEERENIFFSLPFSE